MKVCYYNHVGKVSGAEQVLFTLIANLGPEYEKTLIAPTTIEMQSFCEKYSVRHLSVKELQARFTLNPLLLCKYALSALSGIANLRKLVKHLSPDLLHANSTRAGMIGSLATVGTGIPVVWHIHDQFRKHPITNFISIILQQSRRNFIIAVSHATAESIRKSIGTSISKKLSITVIYNSVDCSRYMVSQQAKQTFLTIEGLVSYNFIVAMVGQITSRKGQAEIIEEFAIFLKANVSNACLLIVGRPLFNKDHIYMATLKASVRRLEIEKNVFFMGHRSDIALILSSSHLLVSNSSSEPFSIVLLEACACGTPILAAAVDGVPELITDRITGSLFEHGDLPAMQSALRSLAGNEEYAAQLGLAAQKRVLHEFTQERFMDQTKHLYDRVLNASRSNFLNSATESTDNNPTGCHERTGIQEAHDT